MASMDLPLGSQIITLFLLASCLLAEMDFRRALDHADKARLYSPIPYSCCSIYCYGVDVFRTC